MLKVTARSLATKREYAPDDETILKYAKQALERPRDAAFWDDDLYNTHTLMFHSAPASDDLVSQSNYHSILRDLSHAYRRSPGAIDSGSIGHWTYSSFDCIKVRVTYADGTIHPAFVDALAIALGLQDYPLYDESDYSEREWSEWERAISEETEYALSDLEDADAIREGVLEYLHSDEAELMGYREVGSIPQETMDAAIAHAREN